MSQRATQHLKSQSGYHIGQEFFQQQSGNFHYTNGDYSKNQTQNCDNSFENWASWQQNEIVYQNSFERKRAGKILQSEPRTGRAEENSGNLQYSGEELLSSFVSMTTRFDQKGKNNNNGENRDNSLRKVFVSNLPYGMKDSEIIDLFSINFGRVVSACRAKPRNGRLESYGFVTFETESAASRCLEMKVIFSHGKKIRCSKYVEKRKYGERGNGYNYGNGEYYDNQSEVSQIKIREKGEYGYVNNSRLPPQVFLKIEKRAIKGIKRVSALDDKPTKKAYWNYWKGMDVYSHELGGVNEFFQNIRLNKVREVEFNGDWGQAERVDDFFYHR